MDYSDGQELGCFCQEGIEGFVSDLTDEEEGSTMVEIPAVRCLKRRYDGVFVNPSATLAVPVRRPRRRIHEQFAQLRAAVPDLFSDEKGSILTGACDYIEKLKKLEAELRCELDMDSCGDEEGSCCEDDEVRGRDSGGGLEEASSSSRCSLPKVVVVRTEQGLKLHVECETRPGLLLGMMEMLESLGLTVDEANIECVDERLVFDAMGISEGEAGRELRGELDEMGASVEDVGARLRSLISDRTQGAPTTGQEE